MSQEARCLTQFKQWVKHQCEAPGLLWLTQLNKMVLRTVEMLGKTCWTSSQLSAFDLMPKKGLNCYNPVRPNSYHRPLKIISPRWWQRGYGWLVIQKPHDTSTQLMVKGEYVQWIVTTKQLAWKINLFTSLDMRKRDIWGLLIQYRHNTPRETTILPMQNWCTEIRPYDTQHQWCLRNDSHPAIWRSFG